MQGLAVVGLGKLGLAMVAVYASKGYDVLGIDVSQRAVDAARAAEPLSPEPGVRELLKRSRKRTEFSLDFKGVSKAEMTFIIVPTPTEPGEDGFSNDYVLAAIREVGKALRKRRTYHIVVIVSTVMPGSTNGVIRSALEKAAVKKVGRKLGLCYNPEFVALGSVVRNMLNADVQLIGESDGKAGRALAGFHRTITPDVPLRRMPFREAEFAKLLLNVALSSRITYANMVGRIADSMGCDARKILGAITCDSRIGEKFMRPGSPVEGPCLPRDVKALMQVLDDSGIPSDLPRAMTNENAYLLRHVRDLLLSGGPCRVAILGWSYKPGTPLTDESAAFPLAEMLLNAGCRVTGYDPEAKIDAKDVDVADSAEGCIEYADKVYVHTPWPEFADLDVGKRKLVDFWNIVPRA